MRGVNSSATKKAPTRGDKVAFRTLLPLGATIAAALVSQLSDAALLGYRTALLAERGRERRTRSAATKKAPTRGGKAAFELCSLWEQP
ncbi:MAG: hypothetical protein IKC73_04770, partial [Clostridia bacterium]|nr:hypothetical protein [Clostridia bacterium]